MLEQDKCWEAIQKRDKRRDGTFFYGVLTTACTAGRLAVLPVPPSTSRKCALLRICD